MAIYTTFFVCRPEELVAGFPGWRLPLAEPVRREVKNPFTGKTVIVHSREPEWPEDSVEDLVSSSRQIFVGSESFEVYLENRLPAFVRARPHWCGKRLTEIELGLLGEAAGVETSFECPLYGPHSSPFSLMSIPASLCDQLVACDQQALDAIAEKWASMMSTPEKTHSSTGHKFSDGWTVDHARSVLQPIVAVARQAVEGKCLYLLTEV